MQPAESGEFGAFKSWNSAEDLDLRAVLQLRLEADHVVERAECIILSELDDRIGLDGRIVRIGETDGFHRAVAQRLCAALRHHLDGEAAVEVRRAFPFLEARLVAGEHGREEAEVLVSIERAIDVVRPRPAGTGLVVA